MTTPRLDSAPIDPGPRPVEPPAPASALPHPPRHPRTPRSDRFFAWTAGLGIVRGDGWIGGIAAGLAARMRIDPLIVRGILVVIGLFGFPVLFLYAIAWALLPDLDGRIPLQEAIRGRFSPALVGIAICAVLGLFPAPLAVLIGAPNLLSLGYQGGGITVLAVFATLVGVCLVGGLIFLIVRAAVHPPRTTDPAAHASDQRTASAASEAPEPSDAASGSGPVAFADADAEGVDAAGFAASIPTLTVPEPVAESVEQQREPADPADASEPAPTVDAGDPEDAADGVDPSATADTEYAAWREQHAAWKVQDDAWRRDQQDAARAARDQARRERHAHGAAFTAEAAKRRRVRRLTKPRTPFAYVAAVIGLAIVAGALAALTAEAELATAVGLFVAALILALAMVTAGILRRRSGFLAFVTVVALLGGAVATALPAAQSLHLQDFGISNAPGSQRYPADDPFVQPWANLTIFLGATAGPTQAIHVEKGSGGTTVTVESAVTAHLDITAPEWATTLLLPDGSAVPLRDALDATVSFLPDGRLHYVGTIAATSDGPTTEQTLVIDQQSGWIDIHQLAPTEESE